MIFFFFRLMEVLSLLRMPISHLSELFLLFHELNIIPSRALSSIQVQSTIFLKSNEDESCEEYERVEWIQSRNILEQRNIFCLEPNQAMQIMRYRVEAQEGV